ncbi:hypothetical protein N7532_005304 [Penicillium argentinense]|uniref:ASTRA-associated protein 1 n=1 Tax=Penicillium argentinense TaxID=1131581 RepID=A0A9W9FDN3_9EURO|nr:uncharacterized protein N7532_005304 [Penicillium argentinense]KAJ5098303.1 hypothetical protein N7532_005304 [Penicillium argentinense]
MAEASGKKQQSAATPVYILRGHAAPIHALYVFSQNLRLVSGDAEGWIVVWDLVTKRPVTVWKAHKGAVLEVKGFSIQGGGSEIYTHGRDHKLCVWRLRKEDEDLLDKSLPVDATVSDQNQRTQPWLLHSLPVNALNFCAFSMSFIDMTSKEMSGDESKPEDAPRKDILFAVPNALDSGGIDIFHLPSERRLTTIRSDPAIKTGMVMGVNLFVTPSGDIFVTSAYEDGHVMAFVRRGPLDSSSLDPNYIASNPWTWEKLYGSRPHTQPVLSIDTSPTRDFFFSSSADALIIKHPIPTSSQSSTIGNQEDLPMKTINTKHSGQQGLRIRGDGKVLATAGWDSRVRVYSCKTMKELAVLKWHKEGCYAVAFGEANSTTQPASSAKTEPEEPDEKDNTTQRYDASLANIHQQRNHKIQQTHWLAVGSKDGKISLWDIY